MPSINCNAKINLWLKVKGKRTDGFHEIETMFCEITLADKLTWNPGPGDLRLNVKSEDDLGKPEDNLVMRAADLFARETGKQPCGTILLEKHIPAGGGLGGGSSDGAGALDMFNRHFGYPLDVGGLLKLAAELGSDVPYFLYGGCCIGRGRGERLEVTRLTEDLGNGWLLLPNIHISTRDVFEALGPIEPRDSGPAAIGENDLLEPAIAVSLEFGAIWHLFEGIFDHLGTMFMSGSGSAIVWLYDVKDLPEWAIDIFDKLCIDVVPFDFVNVYLD